MQSVNFCCSRCIGNTSAPLHLLLKLWLLKVDSKHRLCWLSACLYIRIQIVGRLTACCCQRNNSCPQWPHLLVCTGELWTAMSFIWSVSHRHFLSQVPPLGQPPSAPKLCLFSLLIKRKSYPETPLFPFISFSAIAVVGVHCFPEWNDYHHVSLFRSPFFPSLHNRYYPRVNTWVNDLICPEANCGSSSFKLVKG